VLARENKPFKRFLTYGHGDLTALTRGVIGRVIQGQGRPSANTLSTGTIAAVKQGLHSTFFQKVLICAFAGFLAASLVEWAKVFVEGADDALNKGYKHRAVLDSTK